MKFHGVNIVGKLHVQRVTTLPTWASTDVGRFLYAEDVQGLFYGTASAWSGSPVIVDSTTSTVINGPGTDSTGSPRKYRLIVWEGNMQLQEIVVT